MPHPDLEVERARLAFFRKCLDEMRARTEAFVAREEILAASEVDGEAVRWQLEQRLKSLEDQAVLCFGRIDEEARPGSPASARGREPTDAGATVRGVGGAQWYIGRRHIDDLDGEPVVVDWRAPVAIPFYRATAADPFGLERRRRFTFVGRELADIYEEDFTDPESVLAETGAHGVPDPLLAELRRERTGQMRDIVATIQAEQDEVIRAPLAECLVVQGGPGTGKTAVGLHRAAFLLYEHRAQLSRSGVLVLGPNRVFLDYIAQVLPSLGETSVTQTTFDGLFGLRFRTTLVDSRERARLLGDARMAHVVERACDAAITVPSSDVALRYRSRVLRFTPAEIASLVDEVRAREAPRRDQRTRFRARLLREAYERWSGGEPLAVSEDEFSTDVLAHRESRTSLDAIWKPQNAVSLVRSLMTSRGVLARAADGVLDADEQRLVRRTRSREGSEELWSIAELPLLDEAEARLTGELRRYGHVVVDEAQDHSPMALRVIGRRAVRHSLTVLGDLAQATGAAAVTDWRDALAQLGAPRPVARRAELTIGYRLPAAILEYANQLLAEAAPDVTPARSARQEGDAPELVQLDDEAALVDAVVVRASTLAEEHMTTAVIAPESVHDALRDGGLAAGALGDPLVLLDPATAKGLEFDAVVVVEPATIVAESDGGVRLLYVALTRAVQHLTVAHSQALPPALR
jgi:DNA helicase IV